MIRQVRHRVEKRDELMAGIVQLSSRVSGDGQREGKYLIYGEQSYIESKTCLPLVTFLRETGTGACDLPSSFKTPSANLFTNVAAGCIIFSHEFYLACQFRSLDMFPWSYTQTFWLI